MLNLLFISDSLKVEFVKEQLQPVVKVIIDVVADFDRGLREVLDKRPTIICIQDQIGGVTGESVARHIQMLLGSGAPNFILLHEGNGKVRTINGLFEYMVDLSQGNDSIITQVIDNLKFLLGDQWSKIHIEPPCVPSVFVSQNVEDSTGNDTAELLSRYSHGVTLADLVSTADHPIEPPEHAVSSASPSPLAFSHVAAEDAPIVQQGEPQRCDPSSSDQLAELLMEEARRGESTLQMATPLSEFRISPDTSVFGDVSTSEAVTDNNGVTGRRSHFWKRRSILVLTGALAVAGGVSFVALRGGDLSLPQHLTGMINPKQPIATVTPAPPIQKPAPVLPQPSVPMVKLPSFIPTDGHDRSFSDNKPGWERYVGGRAEFRTFVSSGRLRAVQVLSVEGTKLPVTLLPEVLHELTGDDHYRITSRSSKAGILVESGTTSRNGDILIYRKKDTVQAFVVSVK